MYLVCFVRGRVQPRGMNASEKKNWWLFSMFSHSILTGTTCRMFQEGLKVFHVLVQCASRLNHSISLWVNSADHQSLIIAQEQQAVLEGLKKERDARRLQFPGCHTCFAGSFTAIGYCHLSGICTDLLLAEPRTYATTAELATQAGSCGQVLH